MKKTIFIVANDSPVIFEISNHLRTKTNYDIILSSENDIDITKIDSITRFFDSIDLKAVIIPTADFHPISIEDADESQWDTAFKNGALVSMLMTRAAGEHYRIKGDGGIIIYLGSIHAEKPTGGDFMYSIQCSATQMMCREAAIAYGEYNVNCFYIQRGVMKHDIEKVGKMSNIYSGTELRYPKKKLLNPNSINGLIEFLLTDSASTLSGSDIKADEGLTMYYGNRGGR